MVQSFACDAHDKLTSGNAGGEVYSYDANGNQTGLNYHGSFYTFAFDDEDRLTAVTNPGGLNDSFLYKGLGQRVAKTDSTGQFALVSDGAAPAAPVLADGLTVFTPGLSSRRNGASQFRHGDLLGSLRFETDANQTVTANRLYSAFGSTVASAGDPLMPFGWVGDGESQTDADTGLVLMGHRVYDSRLGRFLSQDPAGDGDNWYAYTDNDPINEDDPSGLISQTTNGGMSWGSWGQLQDAEQGLDPGTYDIYSKQSGQSGDGTFLKTITISAALNGAFTSTSGPMMFAGQTLKGPGGTTYRQDFKEKPAPDMHVYHSGGDESVINYKGGENPDHGGKPTIKMSKKLRKAYRPIIRKFVKKAALHLGEEGLEALGKFAAKKVPFLGWAIIAYSVYQVWRDPDSTWVDYGMAVIF